MVENYQALRRQEGAEREADDFYATDGTVAIPALMKLLGWEHGGKLILENSCGQGHLSKPMEAMGHTVISTDLVDRGYGIGGVDFLKPHWTNQMPYDGVVMNPPYKDDLPVQFILRSLEIAPVVCAFLRITALESVKRHTDLYSKHPPRYVAVFIKRCPSSKNGKFINDDGTREVSSVCYAWFIFFRGYQGEPGVKWI